MPNCADPILCYTKGNSRIFRHWSLANSIFKMRHDQVFNCGKCIFCRKKKSYELAIRCVLHGSLYDKKIFITLTYDEKKQGYHNNLQYNDIQKFKKRLRQYALRTYGAKIQVFNVHEYGKKGKKHWHLIAFNIDFPDRTLHEHNSRNPLFISATLQKLWPHGFSTIGSVTEASAMYQAQYTQKDVKHGNSNNSKTSKSNHSGIGRDYFLRHYKQLLSLGYIPFSGKKIPLPRYFEKIAHKHYSHFYAPENFFDIPNQRKRLYTPFKKDQENKEIADLFLIYAQIKAAKVKNLTEEWETFIDENLHSNTKPDFIVAAENHLYDLKNKKHTGDF